MRSCDTDTRSLIDSEFALFQTPSSWYDLSEMSFKALGAKCPKTGADLLFGRDLPVEDSNYIHIKSIMDFPLKVARCPIAGCGEHHSFEESDLHEEVIADLEPESTEEQTCGEFVIEMAFYKLSDGRYKVWPCLRRVGATSESRLHFAVETVFPTKDVARTVALMVGQDNISRNQV
jgi:hypothetical protein